MTPVLTVYTRDGCHLCEEAIELLRSFERPDLLIEEVDIETDEELHRRYLERIPVVALDGVELYEFRVDIQDLARRLDRFAGR